MSVDKVGAADIASATCVYNGRPDEQIGIAGRYEVVCYDKDGSIKWQDVIDNLVVTVGRNLILDTVLGNSAAGAVYMGLKGTGTAAATDTQNPASPARAWNEVGGTNAPAYTGDRKTITSAFSSASSGSKALSSAQSFAMTSSGTVAGCFVNIGGSATKDNTTGTLFSAGDFTGGSKTVANGDTISVSYTAAVTSS
jgi:hypothetical protein